MADSIKLSTLVLLVTATKVRNCNTYMDAKLQDIMKTMKDLDATWKSDAATAIIANMNALQPEFERYKTIVESYAKFLEKSAQSYEQTEQSVQTYADQFK